MDEKKETVVVIKKWAVIDDQTKYILPDYGSRIGTYYIPDELCPIEDMTVGKDYEIFYEVINNPTFDGNKPYQVISAPSVNLYAGNSPPGSTNYYGDVLYVVQDDKNSLVYIPHVYFQDGGKEKTKYHLDKDDQEKEINITQLLKDKPLPEKLKLLKMGKEILEKGKNK
jgi:hypothetical protein